MRASVFRESGLEELQEKLVQFKTELAKERASIASGSRSEKPATIKNLRKDIARVLTVMTEKEAAGKGAKGMQKIGVKKK